MFPSPVTSTPFSVKDILSLEQHPSGLASLELSALGSPSSCMLATFKQESYPAEDGPLAEAPAGLAKGSGSGSTFPGPFFAKSYVEIEPTKEPKESKKGSRGGREGGSARVLRPRCGAEASSATPDPWGRGALPRRGCPGRCLWVGALSPPLPCWAIPCCRSGTGRDYRKVREQ